MDIINLAHRLGLTNEEKIDRTQEFRKTRYINVSDAEKYICTKYVEDKIVGMMNEMNRLSQRVQELEKEQCKI